MIRTQDYGQNLLTASAAADAANDALELTGGEFRLRVGARLRRDVRIDFFVASLS